ncbi:ZIP family metal transporter [Nocardia arizonensis]|uniref:ZIP family metal transporter n=1 Tax=Nocardia arizonensis TaxID=1141647 RepID=UPI0006D05CD0|nr:metal transporter [Nocardia arizonensis]
MAEPAAAQSNLQRPAWVRLTGVALVIAAALSALFVFGARSLPQRQGPPIEEVAVEHTVLTPGEIELKVRNTGPDPVTVAQVFVNDVYVDVRGGAEPIGRKDSTTLELTYPWVEGQPYKVSMLTSTGVVIEHDIAAAVATPRPGAGFFGLMALLGTYVGVIPVLLGMLLLPVIRRSGAQSVRVLLALTVGMLVFLVVDGSVEGLELADASAGAFGGVELVVLGAAAAFLTLTAVDRYLSARRARAAGSAQTGLRLSGMVAAGIGLHNLGEGLAIGSAYAVGELALGAFLVLGFALHNTTEGFAIVAPLVRARTSVSMLAALGLLAGAPAILGAVIGASVNNAELSAMLLGVGVGAIAQVLTQIVPSLRAPESGRFDVSALTGVIAGLAVMYVTGLLVAV